jgi:predicted ATPase
MKRYILTGTPGSGKTALLRLLEVRGYAVVEEAATDVIALAQAQGRAEPWTEPSFIDDIVALQKLRQLQAGTWGSALQFFDRSPVCSWALAEYLGFSPSPMLCREVARIEREGVYERRVLFVQNLGFCVPTSARRISFEDSLRFEELHVEAYRSFGYDCVRIAAADLASRFASVQRAVEAE